MNNKKQASTVMISAPPDFDHAEYAVFYASARSWTDWPIVLLMYTPELAELVARALCNSNQPLYHLCMSANRLKLNMDKTEWLWTGTRSNLDRLPKSALRLVLGKDTMLYMPQPLRSYWCKATDYSIQCNGLLARALKVVTKLLATNGQAATSSELCSTYRH